MNGKTMLNGVPYFSDTQVIELTRAEYDALPNSKYTDGVLYCIKDEGVMKGDTFSPIIYSLAEREVGVHTNGKPLYEKTFVINNPTANDGFQDSGEVIPNLDECISLNWYAYRVIDGTELYYTGNGGNVTESRYNPNYRILIRVLMGTNNKVQYLVSSDYSTQIQKIVVTERYTKTTDNPGTGKWTTSGVPTHHYSTDEQVIGTWIDGSTIYERTYHYTGTLNSNTWVTIDSSRLPSNTPYFSVMNVCFISTELSSSAKFSAYKPSIPFDITISTNEQLYFENKSNYKIYEFVVTIQYTKSS